jgi:hypothetical protein
MTCKQLDRECPKLVCGHPLPCPWHTVVIDTTRDPPTLTIPITAEAAWKNRDKLAEIGKAITTPEVPKSDIRKLDPEEN